MSLSFFSAVRNCLPAFTKRFISEEAFSNVPWHLAAANQHKPAYCHNSFCSHSVAKAPEKVKCLFYILRFLRVYILCFFNT